MSYTRFFMGTLAIVMLFIAGCGAAASAPPVDLPAPVVGRITVGTPDATGKATITGTEGAVPGGSIVLAINSRLEGSASLLWKLTDALVPAAHAQTLPEICSFLGHFCAIADADGSFVLIVDALIGDDIIIVIIDEEGIEVTDRVSFIIPSTSLAIGLCESADSVGAMTDLMSIGGDPLSLYEGKDSKPNRLKYKSFELPLPGCYARSIAFAPAASVGAWVAVASDLDNLLWIALTSGGDFITADTYELDDRPLALAFVGEAGHLAIVLETSTGFAVGRLSLVDGTIDNLIALPEPTSAYEFTELIDLEVIGPFNDGGYLGAVILAGSDGSSTGYFMHFFETSTYHLSTVASDALYLNSPTIFGPNAHIVDSAMSLGSATTGDLSIIFSDDFNNELWIAALQRSGANVNLVNDNASLFQANVHPQTPPNGLAPPVLGTSPKRLAVGVSTGLANIYPVAYVLIEGSSAYNMWKAVNFAQNPQHYADNIPGAADPDLIAVDTADKSILIGDAGLLDILDASSFWFSDL